MDNEAFYMEINKHYFSLLQGSASFVLGLFLIFVRWPILGIIIEIYGCVFLFRLVDGFLLEFSTRPQNFIVINLSLMIFGCSGFWSSVKVFLYHIPVVGWIIRFIARKFFL